MNRLRSFYPQLVPQEDILELTYILQSSSVIYYMYKWFRNYSSSEPYVMLGLQKLAASLVFAALMFTIAYGWNATYAGWDENSLLYVPNATKMAALFAVFGYIFVRGVKIPWNKGCFWGPNRCSPVDILPITLISALLDLSKIAAFGHLALKKLYRI